MDATPSETTYDNRREEARRRFGELLMGSPSKSITQLELMSVLKDRKLVQELRKRLSEAEGMLAAKEALVIQKLKSGARSTGRLKALIEVIEGAVRPQWKDRFLIHMEQDHGVPRILAEARIRQDTKVPRKERLAISEGPPILATAVRGHDASHGS